VSFPRVHQLLHGYRNGHELLAGSVKLSSADSELVARLSDLSGTLQSDVRFYPYVTAYPLPSGTHYAIARTWLDKEAPRSGCVLTRTALVAMLDWQRGDISMAGVLEMLSPPSRDNTSSIQHPLSIETDLFPSSGTSVPGREIEAFVAKYFGEGIRPIVWLRDGGSDDILVSISRVLWPQLRRRFAACTLSLQPRNLADAPFDLLFAPTAVYSRFSKIGRENFIEASNLGKSRQGREEWMVELARLISASGSPPVTYDAADLSNALGPEPTSIRWLYLLNDLRSRTKQSPTAALGAMDVVERLCSEPTSEAELKESVAQSALLAADQIEDARPALSFLQLVCERLSHSPYSRVSERILEDLRFRVEKRAHKALDQALASYEELMGRTSADDRARRSFQMGIVDGIKWLGETNSSDLIILHNFDGAAADIVPLHSEIGRSYLKLRANAEFRPSTDLIRWLKNRARDVNWTEWATTLGSIDDGATVDSQLFGECLSRLSSEGVGIFLDQTRNAKVSDELADAIETHLVPTNSLLVRRWAFSLQPQSEVSSRIASATFDLSLAGLVELLEYEPTDRAAKIAVLIELLGRLPRHGRLPDWLFGAFGQSRRLMVELVQTGSDKSGRASEIVCWILRERPNLADEELDMLLPELENLADRQVMEALVPLLVRSILLGTLRGKRSINDLKRIDHMPILSTWLSEVDGSRLASLFSEEIAQSRDRYDRAWLVLADAPEALYRSRRLATITIISQLLRQSHVSWSHEISGSWRVVLGRAKALCEPRYYIRHCVQALGFSLASTRLPVSAVVRSAFPDVYETVVEESPYNDEANSLVSYDWDRAKGLRRTLVDSFYQSSWPEGDLALTAAESFGLRKLFRRVWRKWSGEEYVARMIADLRRRDEPLANSCMLELLAYYQKPNFYEPWD